MSSVRRQYPFHLIEPKWQTYWDAEQTFRAWNPGEVLAHGHPFALRHGLEGKTPSASELPRKFYILDMFPYPSGAGLHVGHPEGYTATDILARYRRACGFNVLHPMGWDAFGLPAEQYAIKTGQHPRKTTEVNVATFKRQIKSLGFSYDWTREVDTTDQNYFKWTQWIFLQLYNSWFNPETNKAEPINTLKYPTEPGTDEVHCRAWRDYHRLAYVEESPVWWCEQLGTVLANEEVVDGRSEVGGHPVVRKPMRQWMLRITKYAERLLQDLDTIDWSDSLKEMQRNWIGRSEGARVRFQVADHKPAPGGDPLPIWVFTTRPDTLFGATYLVLSPEHKLVDTITTVDHWDAVKVYRVEIANKSDLERTELAKEKTGVFTGAYAVNPVNGERIPIWIADYVLASYGTGAIMAVPAHDQRDLEFATKFKLPVVPVIEPGFQWMKNHYNPLAAIEITPGQFLRVLYGTDHPTKTQLEESSEESFKSNVELEKITEKLVRLTGTGKEFCETCIGLLLMVSTTSEASPEVLALLHMCYQDEPQFFTKRFTPEAFADAGRVTNSANDEVSLNELSSDEAKEKITAWLEAKGLGKRTINYKLRDWLFSRQRYWGEPFPIIWKKDAAGNLCHEALPESALPLLPPPLDDYKPTPDGQPPLARAKDWLQLADGSVRETNTMPQWAGSCWYYLRYLDAKNVQSFVSKDVEQFWMGAVAAVCDRRPSTGADTAPLHETPGVDLYVGGTEHAVLHLLYARFWHKVLYDLGYVSTPEPFFKLVNQGLILGEDGQKMSKARGNVVNPDDMVNEFGADALRLYEMFMGPLQDTKPWNTQGVAGVYKFLGRVWRLFVDEQSETDFEQAAAARSDSPTLLEQIKLSPAIQQVEAAPAQLKTLHACIKKVTEDLDGMRFNTAISAMMVFVNDAISWKTKPASVFKVFLQLLAPFAPHLAEELWQKLHLQFAERPPSLTYAPWPQFDPALLVENEVEIPVQVNGKLRDVIRVATNADSATIEAAARNAEKVKPFLEGKTVRKVIVVPGKLVNLVVG